MAEQIVVQKEYFTNIETAVNAINKFFDSNYKEKNFPMLDGSSDLDPTITKYIEMFNAIDPTWIDDPLKVESIVNEINDVARNYDASEEDVYTSMAMDNRNMIDKVDAYVCFKQLQKIADHFQEFGNILNGIHSLELFTIPSKFRSEIELFYASLDLSEIDSVMGEHAVRIFSIEDYVNGLFESEQVTLPSTLDVDEQIERVKAYKAFPSDVPIITDETIQEAAEVNFFKNTKPQHIKYDIKTKKFVLSDQLQKVVDGIVANIKKCDTTKELREYFSSSDALGKGDKCVPDMLSASIMPFVIAKVYNNESKFPDGAFDVDALGNYIKSYKSIMDRNPGAKRFVNYDIFSTFKIDKEGTIKFVKDFLNLDLVNSSSATITNNGLLSCFNIFDSRIYLDILYNILPDSEKKDKYETEDGFVKFIRARVNKNSRGSNTYAEDKAEEKPNNETETTKDVAEYALIAFKQFGNMSTTDMHLCEHYHTLLKDELNTIDSKIFSEGISPIELGEEVDILMEVYKGTIPEYMKTRVQLSDDEQPISLTNVPAQPMDNVPSNPIPDLTSSINEKIGAADEFGNMLGSEAIRNGTNVVYNITNNYNYTNSFNTSKKNIHKTTDNSIDKTVTNTDNSHGKTTTSTKVKISTGKHMEVPNHGAAKNTDIPINNNNNSEDRHDTSEEDPQVPDFGEDVQEFASGMSITDVFALLESAPGEPLSSEVETMQMNDAPPKADMLTTAMDNDRDSLGRQQGMKRVVQKGVNTARTIIRPATRTKQWLAGIVDSLVQRQEDKVKADIIENPSYRTSLFKASRLALKLGLTGILFTINGFIGAAYVAANISSVRDKERLKKEVQGEFAAELEILNDKIRLADQDNTPEARKAKWQMMRMRSQMTRIVADTPASIFKTSNTIV